MAAARPACPASQASPADQDGRAECGATRSLKYNYNTRDGYDYIF